MEGQARDAFELPELYHFPPFFTIQPVLDTRQKQLLAWQRLLLDWHRSRNRYSLEVNEWELFDNPAINRKLDRKGRETVLDFLVQNGHAQWEDAATKNRCKVYWRSLEDWAAALYQLASDRAMVGSVYTLFELHSGDTLDFNGMDPEVFRQVVKVLESDGRAQVFDVGGQEGVKFFESS